TKASSDSGELPRTRQRRGFELVAPFQRLLRREILGALDGIGPGYFLAGIGRHAAHDRKHRAVQHPVAVVDDAALADGVEEFVVLDLIHVLHERLVAEAPALLAVNHRGAAALRSDEERALGAADDVGGLIVAAGDLAAAEVAD